MGFLGKEVRLNRLLNKQSGKLLAITVDHPIGRGVHEGLVNIRKTLEEIIAGNPDSLTVTKGIIQSCFLPYAGKVALIMKSSSFSPYLPSCDTVTADVEEAVRLGADAISMGLILGGEFQNQQIENLGKLTKQAESYGMPVVAHIYPKGEYIKLEERSDWKNIRYCVRVGAEMGVDIIKTTYTGDPESFAKVVEACPSRVVAAGGDNFADPSMFLKQTKDIMLSGAAGITYGRGVWESGNTTNMVRALNCIVNNAGSVEEALEIFLVSKK